MYHICNFFSEKIIIVSHLQAFCFTFYFLFISTHFCLYQMAWQHMHTGNTVRGCDEMWQIFLVGIKQETLQSGFYKEMRYKAFKSNVKSGWKAMLSEVKFWILFWSELCCSAPVITPSSAVRMHWHSLKNIWHHPRKMS